MKETCAPVRLGFVIDDSKQLCSLCPSDDPRSPPAHLEANTFPSRRIFRASSDESLCIHPLGTYMNPGQDT